jgi:hypothetical protein
MDESGPLLSYLSETVDVMFLVSDLFFFFYLNVVTFTQKMITYPIGQAQSGISSKEATSETKDKECFAQTHVLPY